MADKSEHTKRWTISRRVVQVLAVIVFCLPLLVAGWGLFGQFAGTDVESPVASNDVFWGSLSASQLFGFTIIDPLSGLEALAAARTFDLGILLGILPAVIFYGIISGRAFCGWICPVNFVLEGVDFIREKLGIHVKERTIPRRAKIWVALAIVLLSAILAIPVFESFNPISFINKGILFGSLVGSFTLLAIVIAELFWSRRVWCRAICPIGGLYEAIGRVGQVNVRMDYDKCIHCGNCEKACIADPVILKPVLSNEDVIVRAGDCMLCGKCIDSCPTAALSMRLGRPRKRLQEATEDRLEADGPMQTSG